MRTTIELPDELLTRARVQAAESGISLKDLFIEALMNRLELTVPRRRRTLPVLGGPEARTIGTLTSEQIDEAMFG